MIRLKVGSFLGQPDGQKLILTNLLDISDVGQSNDFVPLGVGAFETKMTGWIKEIQLKRRKPTMHECRLA